MQVGGNLGAVLTMPLSAYLVQHGFAGGWPSVFYVTGSVGCLCFVLWIYQIYNSPAEHPRIGDKELKYIEANVSVSYITTISQIARLSRIDFAFIDESRKQI